MWIAFYKLYPFDDLHRYHRPAALISYSAATAFGPSSMKFQERLEFLQPSKQVSASNDRQYSEADMNTLRAFGFQPEKKG
jgi:hypothetical protein